MDALESLVPMRWQSGPLETGRRRRDGSLTPAGAQTLERWHQPAALEILGDSPFNALVIGWAAGEPEDAEQQSSAAALIRAARDRKLAVIGWVEGTANSDAAIATAKSAGLSAVAIRGYTGKSDFPVIPWGGRTAVPWDSAASVLPIAGDNVWPGVHIAAGGADAAAGPTGVPWLDSNGWYIQLARARTAKPLWLLFDPPGKGTVVTAESYAMAVADTESAGARWVVSLDDSARAGLLAGDAGARKVWSSVVGAARFFEAHRSWNGFSPLGIVGVLSDYTGENLDTAGEILNLMARRGLPFRAIWKPSAGAPSFAGLKAVLYPDSAPPSNDLRQALLQFARDGGLLVAGPQWASEGAASAAASHPRYDIRALGKGRVAVAKDGFSDSYQVASDMQVLVSYGNDLVKLFNAGASGGFLYTGAADGKTALVQILIYAGGRGTDVITVWTRRRYRQGRMWTPGAAGPAVLRQAPADGGAMDFYLPPVVSPAFVGIELEA